MKIGIIGTGRIARRFVPEALCIEGLKISAVYNPHDGSAERFIEECINEAYKETVFPTSDLKYLLDDVDAIYIASPHETHYNYIKEALTNGKHVLCEKPMVLNGTQAEECFGLANERHCVLVEGIKTAYCSGYKRLIETAKSGIIGDIRYIDSCFTKIENPGSRERTDRKYGGSFTELGSYVMLPIIDLYGEQEYHVNFSKIEDTGGIDDFTKAEFSFPGHLATAVCALGVKAEGRLLVCGTKGYIRADAPWWKTTHYEVHFEDPTKVLKYDFPFEGDGLRYEITAFLEQISGAGMTEHASGRSVQMAKLMEQFLAERKSGK